MTGCRRHMSTRREVAGGVGGWAAGEKRHVLAGCFKGHWNIPVFCFLLQPILVSSSFLIVSHFICFSNADNQSSLQTFSIIHGSRGACVAQPVRRQTLGFSSGCNPRVTGSDEAHAGWGGLLEMLCVPRPPHSPTCSQISRFLNK